MTRPDFFIVGAPKCGTTALHKYLRGHPEIFMPDGKDRCFFGSDLITSKRFSTAEFSSRFDGRTDQKRVGESCVHYLYSKTAPREIKEFAPDARIIIMLRNPVDLLYSWHSQLLYLGTENISDFEAALRAEPARRRGENIPNPLRVQNSLYYREIGRLADHVARYFDTFGRDQVLTILLEDFAASTTRVYQDTLRFLGLSPEFDTSLPVVNANKKPRSQYVHSMLTGNRLLKALARGVLPSADLRRRLIRPIQRWNKVYEPRRPLRPDLRRALQREYAEQVTALGQLIGRDLSHWNGDSVLAARSD
jgi:hypothetical protein